MTIRFSTCFVIVGFAIFFYCKFPFRGLPEHFMIAFGCMQYALGVYVGRKLFNIAHMLNSIVDIRITKDIFGEDELTHIVNYVNILSTFTVIFVYVHVRAYFLGPFQFDNVFGLAPKIALDAI